MQLWIMQQEVQEEVTEDSEGPFTRINTAWYKYVIHYMCVCTQYIIINYIIV